MDRNIQQFRQRLRDIFYYLAGVAGSAVIEGENLFDLHYELPPENEDAWLENT